MSLEQRKKQLSDCNRCHNCRWVPVIKSDQHASICPSIDYGKLNTYAASGKLINGYGLLTGAVGYDAALIDSIYACSMCGGCDVGCKTNLGDLIEPMESLYALREKVVSDGQATPAVASLAENLKRHGNAAGQPAQLRGHWCANLNVKHGIEQRAAILLHVGDAAFVREHWPQLQFAVAALQNAGIDFAVAGASEPDCGALAFDLGYRDLALVQARATASWVRNSGARQLITCSDAAFAAFRAVYPRLDVSLGGVEVMHITQWLVDRLETQSVPKATGEQVTYHDACRLGRLSEPYKPWTGKWVTVFNSLPAREPHAPTRFGVGGVYDAPRQILQAAGANLVEMERIREFSYCCGAGGSARESSPKFAAHAARERLEEALGTGAQTLVTSCATCATHLRATAKANGMPIRVTGLLDYLQNSLASASVKYADAV